MLKIRREQGQRIMKTQQDEFDADLVAYLGNRFPSRFTPADHRPARAVVAQAREIGRRYGIDRLDNLGSLADLIVMYGPGFHEEPWAHGILEPDRLHGPDKMALLLHKLRSSGVRV